MFRPPHLSNLILVMVGLFVSIALLPLSVVLWLIAAIRWWSWADERKQERLRIEAEDRYREEALQDRLRAARMRGLS